MISPLRSGIATATHRRISTITFAGLSLLLTQFASGATYYPAYTPAAPSIMGPAPVYAQPLYPVQTVTPAQYQTLPGFQCYYWTAKGECLNYSYYNFNAQTPVSTPSRTPISSPVYPTTSRSLTVRVTGHPDPVEAGDTITYNIYLKNNDTRTVSTDVIAELDEDVTFVSATEDGDDIRTDEVVWHDVYLGSRDSINLTLRVRVRTRVRNGDEIDLSVRAGNATDDAVIEVDDTTNSCYDRYGRYDSSLCDDRYNDDSCYDRYGRYDSDLCDDRYNDDSCYDRYGRYDSDLCDDNYTDDNCYDQYGRYDSDLCDENSIRVNVIDAPDPVRRDDLLTYTIDLEADGNSYQRFDLRAELDPDTTFYSASDGGNLTSRDTVTWRDVFINRNTNRRFTLTVRVDDARRGDTLRLRVFAADDEDEEATYVQD